MKAILVPVCFLGLLAVASADTIQAQIQAMDDAVGAAMMKKDLAGLTTIMKSKTTADFKYYETATSKPMPVDQMLSLMKAGISSMTVITTAEAKLKSVKVTGDTATAITTHTMVGKTTGPDKKPHLMTFTGISTDVLKKDGAGWKLASMTWKTQVTRIDGHLQKAGKM